LCGKKYGKNFKKTGGEEMGIMIKLPDFENEKGLDFSDPKVVRELDQALQEVRATMGMTYPIMISGKRIMTPGRLMRRENPSNIEETVGYVSMANETIADAAIAAMRESEQVREWMRASHAERAEYLRVIAQKLRSQRYFFLALMMIEAGKNRWEADGEFCEAVDFLEYYATYAPFLAELNDATLISGGQLNKGLYEPLGIGVSIQPWNFPLAISIGPLAAGLVMGNPMIYKPAEHTSIIGYYLAQCVYDSWIPEDVFHFVPGYGEEVGNYLVRHPDVKLIAFTGSKDVRRKIQDEVHRFNKEVLPTLPPRDRHEKVIAAAESGGKGTIIVDAGVDLEKAAQGIFDSAFGYQSQKCSAGTRVIVVGDDGSYSALASKIATKADRLSIGSPESPENIMGPVISEEAREKVERYKTMVNDGELVKDGEGWAYFLKTLNLELYDKGYFVGPMIAVDLPIDSPIMQEEIFGPVLAVTQAASFEEALAMANDSEFGLTGAVYTNSDEHWQMAVEQFEVGNLYRNRKTTGAVVGQQPFGGYKMSGNSTKAGGWDYLLNFVRRKTLCTKF
jgi:1-pyrroline-5-carboxylate dehydrogenase